MLINCPPPPISSDTYVTSVGNGKVDYVWLLFREALGENKEAAAVIVKSNLSNRSEVEKAETKITKNLKNGFKIHSKLKGS